MLANPGVEDVLGMSREGPFDMRHVAELLGHMANMDKDVRRRVNVPRDFVFTNRIFMGLYSVLGALRATADWRAIFDEWVTGKPTRGRALATRPASW